MRKEEKEIIINNLVSEIEATPDFYVTDISGLNAENTSKLRRACFEKDIKLVVVKNTLFIKALNTNITEDGKNILPILDGPSAIMFTTVPNAPAKIIKEFGIKMGKPVLKGALIQDCAYVGEDQLGILVNIKSREELIGEIIGLLQSPIKTVISGLKAESTDKITGIVKTLSEKE
ncbi:MAG: 50S ribosomal protein L10 [Bacteroidales bacterium]